jgi:hypothetical protein
MEWNFNLYFLWFVREEKRREDELVETKLIDQTVWFVGWLCEN